jgi:hypothetical protein
MKVDYMNRFQSIINGVDLFSILYIPLLECGGWDSNPRTARDRILSPAPLAELGYPRKHPVDVVDTISFFLDAVSRY